MKIEKRRKYVVVSGKVSAAIKDQLVADGFTRYQDGSTPTDDFYDRVPNWVYRAPINDDLYAKWSAFIDADKAARKAARTPRAPKSKPQPIVLSDRARAALRRYGSSAAVWEACQDESLEAEWAELQAAGY